MVCGQSWFLTSHGYWNKVRSLTCMSSLIILLLWAEAGPHVGWVHAYPLTSEIMCIYVYLSWEIDRN